MVGAKTWPKAAKGGTNFYCLNIPNSDNISSISRTMDSGRGSGNIQILVSSLPLSVALTLDIKIMRLCCMNNMPKVFFAH